jgi:hypothetical protein
MRVGNCKLCIVEELGVIDGKVSTDRTGHLLDLCKSPSPWIPAVNK